MGGSRTAPPPCTAVAAVGGGGTSQRRPGAQEARMRGITEDAPSAPDVVRRPMPQLRCPCPTWDSNRLLLGHASCAMTAESRDPFTVLDGSQGDFNRGTKQCYPTLHQQIVVWIVVRQRRSERARGRKRGRGAVLATLTARALRRSSMMRSGYVCPRTTPACFNTSAGACQGLCTYLLGSRFSSGTHWRVYLPLGS